MALIDKASLLMVPSTYEAGKLYNVLPSGNRAPDSTDQNSGYDQTRADFDFDRGSNAAATRIGSDGLLKKYQENLLLQSNAFNVSPWALTNSSITSGQSGYDGTNNAWKLQSTTIYSSHINQTLTLNGVQTFSVYAKAGTANYLVFYNIASSIPRAWYNLSNGTIESTLNEIDAKIESVGNGWYRCSMTYNQNISQVNIYVSDANGSFSSAIGSNIYIQSAQLETGLVATEYLNSTSVTAKAGVLVDMPRINYDANGENGALLLEPSRANLVVTSEYAGGSGWFISSGYSVAHNVAISPEGVQNAFELTIPSINGNTRAIVSVSPSTEYTFSFYVKRGTATELKYSIFNLTNNTNIIAQTSYYSQTSATEWKRIEVTFTTPAGCTSAGVYLDRDSQANGTAFFYGIQCEAGSYISSYIPNHGTSGGVTRAADSCSVTGVSDVIGQTEGTLFWEGKKTSNLNFATALVIENGTTNRIYLLSGSTGFRVDVTASNTTTAFYSGTHGLGNYKIAIAYNSSSVDVYINGVSVFNDSSVTIPACQNVYLTNWASYNQSIETRQAALFNERLSNAELATLTTL